MKIIMITASVQMNRDQRTPSGMYGLVQLIDISFFREIILLALLKLERVLAKSKELPTHECVQSLYILSDARIRPKEIFLILQLHFEEFCSLKYC